MISLLVNSWPAKSIHGDKSQQERDYVLSGMKTLNAVSCLRNQEFRNVTYILSLMSEFLRLKIGYLQASYALTDHKARFL
jgi:hypothetical protein